MSLNASPPVAGITTVTDEDWEEGRNDHTIHPKLNLLTHVKCLQDPTESKIIEVLYKTNVVFFKTKDMQFPI